MHNIKISHQNNSLSLFLINARYLYKTFDDLQHLLSSTKKAFNITAISETRITKQVSILLNLLQLRLLQVVLFFILLII